MFLYHFQFFKIVNFLTIDFNYTRPLTRYLPKTNNNAFRRSMMTLLNRKVIDFILKYVLKSVVYAYL